jgi:hypothetical protein
MFLECLAVGFEEAVLGGIEGQFLVLCDLVLYLFLFLIHRSVISWVLGFLCFQPGPMLLGQWPSAFVVGLVLHSLVFAGVVRFLVRWSLFRAVFLVVRSGVFALLLSSISFCFVPRFDPILFLGVVVGCSGVLTACSLLLVLVLDVL